MSAAPAALVVAVEDTGDVTAGPIALLIVVVLAGVVVLLVRSMSTRMRNVQRNAETGRWQGYEPRDGGATGGADAVADPPRSPPDEPGHAEATGSETGPTDGGTDPGVTR